LRNLRVLAAVVSVVAAAVGAVTVSGPVGATSYPVTYNFLGGALPGALPPNSDPPGANNWSCKPSAAHPLPVVLVHGLIGNKATNWQTYAPLLANNGYCVFALTYGVFPHDGVLASQFGGREAIEQSATEFGAFIAKVLAATGANKVDIVGHSEGTLMPNYYAKFLGGAQYIDQYISLASLWHGTDVAGLDSLSRAGRALGATALVDGLVEKQCVACTELLASSAFMAKMRSGGTTVVPGIRYTNIVTRYDELVRPYTSGIEPGMTNYVLQSFCNRDFAEHFQIASDPIAARIVLNTLDPQNARPVPCQVVLPLI
jgi:triacylglycerol esterase/lipase EstA (alpha/beta hydrolase family)